MFCVTPQFGSQVAISLDGTRLGSAPPQMAERSEKRKVFDEKASIWRSSFHWRNSETMERTIRNGRWRQYLAREHMSHSATFTRADNSNRKRTVGYLWWNKSQPPVQANLSLERGYTTMNTMFAKLQRHPLVIGSRGEYTWIVLDGKVNARPKVTEHESVYNVKLTTILGFNLTVGYSRYKDPKSMAITHAWVAFGDHCTFQWQRELGSSVC